MNNQSVVLRFIFVNMRFLLVLLLFPLLGNAQKWVGTESHHPLEAKQARLLEESSETVPLDTQSIKVFLKDHISNLNHLDVDLVMENEVHSPKAKHYRFAQTLNGRKLFRGSVKINISLDGNILSVFDHTFPIQSAVESAFPEHAAYHDGLMVHYNTPNNGKLAHYNLQEVYFHDGNEAFPAIRLEVAEVSDRYYELILNEDVKVIYQNDLLSYSTPSTDSTVTMFVFNPDPLTSANESYGAPYNDNSDSDVAELNAERISVTAPVTFQNDTFFLRNDYVSIEEFSFPTIEPVYSLTPVFNYTRAESGFEDVNAYYHINYFQEYIQSLGFNNIVNYPIAVDAHALSGSDNSNFNPGFNPPRLQFGEGGVDDAEDADVIIHEYGHAIMHSAAPNTNNGTERKALDEAVGDYFASSYSRFINSFGWSDVFTWDGHNEFWPGRSTVSSDHYPEDLNNNIYTDSDIWSATLMEIWGDIGQETTDAIMLQAAYSFSEGMTMPQAAVLFIQADALLFSGANFIPIRQRMFDRGLVPWDVGIDESEQRGTIFQIRNTADFSTGIGLIQITSDHRFEYNLYNTVGQLITKGNSVDGTANISSAGLETGVYLLELVSDDKQETVKLLKY